MPIKWIKGQYDSLLNTLVNWYKHYDQGKLVAYKKILNGTEEFVGIKATERAVQLEITDIQFDAIVKLMSEIYPGTKETTFFRTYQATTLKNSKLVQGKRLITVGLPKEVVRGLIELFYEFKLGRIDWSPRTGPNAKKKVVKILEGGTTERQGLFGEEEEEEVEENNE